MGLAGVPQGTRRPGGWSGAARAVSAALVALLASAGFASAQQAISTGTITGIVQDEQGLPIPGATVEVTNLQTQAQQRPCRMPPASSTLRHWSSAATRSA